MYEDYTLNSISANMTKFVTPSRSTFC